MNRRKLIRKLALPAAIIFGVLFLGNLILATRLVPKIDNNLWPWALVKRLQPAIRTGVILLTLFLCLIFGLVAQSNWEVILRTLNWQPRGRSRTKSPQSLYVIAFEPRSLGTGCFMLPWIETALFSIAQPMSGWSGAAIAGNWTWPGRRWRPWR